MNVVWLKTKQKKEKTTSEEKEKQLQEVCRNRI